MKWHEYVEDDIAKNFAAESMGATGIEALLAQLIREVRDLKNVMKDVEEHLRRGSMI